MNSTDYLPAEENHQKRHIGWKGIFVTGLVLWVLSVLVTAVTGSLNMIPTVVLLGSFLVPVTAIVWYMDHYSSPIVTGQTVLRALIVGGVLGVLAASLLESFLLSDGVSVYLGVGLIEELAKLLALLFLARGLARYTIRDGIVLGAAVGFGFAALESSGYALNSLIVQQGSQIFFSLENLVFTELLRGILAPLGHGLWTAILGGVLFAASGRGHLRFTRGVFGTYIGVSLLHALWDSMRGISIVLTALLTATPLQRSLMDSGVLPRPTHGQVETYLAIYLGGLVVVSLVGLIWLRSLWLRRPVPVQEEQEKEEEQRLDRAA